MADNPRGGKCPVCGRPYASRATRGPEDIYVHHSGEHHRASAEGRRKAKLTIIKRVQAARIAEHLKRQALLAQMENKDEHKPEVPGPG